MRSGHSLRHDGTRRGCSASARRAWRFGPPTALRLRSPRQDRREGEVARFPSGYERQLGTPVSGLVRPLLAHDGAGVRIASHEVAALEQGEHRARRRCRECCSARRSNSPVLGDEVLASDEEEKTRVGRRARPPTLLQLVLGRRDFRGGRGYCSPCDLDTRPRARRWRFLFPRTATQSKESCAPRPLQQPAGAL